MIRHKRLIPFHRPSLGRAEERAVCAVLRSGWLTTGPQTQAFEKKFQNYVGTKAALGVNSCTAGLHLILKALGIGKGDEVITSPLTFAATANVIVHCGAHPVFADVLPENGTIDPCAVARRITKRTRALIVVHLGGYPCDMDALRTLCHKKKIAIIEDAAHALGGSYKGQNVGTLGMAAAFSFYATKNITTGEGGMVTTDDTRLAARIALLRLHGLSADAWKRYTPSGSFHYQVLDAGFKYNMFDLQAALGIIQLQRMPAFFAARVRLWETYMRRLRQIPEIACPALPPEGVHARHLFMVRLNRNRLTASRDQIMHILRRCGVNTQVHFCALHLQPFYRNLLGCKPEAYPVASHLSHTLLSLPFYPGLTRDDAHYVCDKIETVIGRVRK